MQCIVSCARKYFMETRLSSLNWFFYFSAKAVSIGIPECFRIPTNANIWTRNQWATDEIFVKSLLFRAGRTNGFPLIQKLTFCLSELLLRAWSLVSCWNYCFFFIWCLEIIMNSYVKNYFLLWVLPKRIKALRHRRSWNVSKSFPQFFLKRFFSIGFCLMNDVKLLQPCACVENFYGNWRIISCLIAWLS